MAKIVLIGANHAGTAAANTILDNYPENQLVIFDSNSNISYLGCGTALWVGQQIDGPDGLFYSSKDILTSKKATVHMETPVEKIDFGAKKVFARDKAGKEIAESYDKLILATGSLPIIPKIKGLDLPQVASAKLFQDGQKINSLMDQGDIKTIAVVGAGYIGVELAEAARRRGKNVLLFEAANTSLSTYYDDWFTQDMDKVLKDHNIGLHFGELVQEIKGASKVQGIVTNKGEYPVDMVIMAIGFRPNTALAAGELETFANGAYKVSLRQETSKPGVYAIGDCATVYSNAVENTAYIALATNAVRSGVVAGHNAGGTPLESIGVQGSNGICIYGYKMVSTGLNLAAAEKAGYTPLYTQFEDTQKPAFIKEDNHKVKIRIVYDKKTRRVLGAQMASYQDISMGIHLFSLAIEEKVTIDKLKLLDIFFLPHFNQPYNYITMAALTAP
ncbi:MAG: FAD-dependent oxidoreductase [Spirochaetaceae bacterium]|jgi:NADPH-dependent 2,4-dienoyl-CoA reductase/sulfur reductase-like enzyme|nr:FAD-dependent oxidoreductase [Spirochaetaceae bacterium]